MAVGLLKVGRFGTLLAESGCFSFAACALRKRVMTQNHCCWFVHQSEPILKQAYNYSQQVGLLGCVLKCPSPGVPASVSGSHTVQYVHGLQKCLSGHAHTSCNNVWLERKADMASKQMTAHQTRLYDCFK